MTLTLHVDLTRILLVTLYCSDIFDSRLIIITKHITLKFPWNNRFSSLELGTDFQLVKRVKTYLINKQWNNRNTRVHKTPQRKIIFQKLLQVECKLFWWTVTYQHDRWIDSRYETLIPECECCSILVDDLVDSERWLTDAENVTTTLFSHPLPIHCQLSFSKDSLKVSCRAREVISPHLHHKSSELFFA